MSPNTGTLMSLYHGWEDHQISLVRTITRLSGDHLAWRPAPHLRSAGELVSHLIALRIQWFQGVFGAGSTESAEQLLACPAADFLKEQPDELVKWLEITWQLIQDTLNGWTVADLAHTYQLPPYQGKTFLLNRQWIIWHVIAHDLHHGGELALMLGMQGVALPELGDEGGHLVERVPLAEFA